MNSDQLQKIYADFFISVVGWVFAVRSRRPTKLNPPSRSKIESIPTMMRYSDDQFDEAKQYWDLERLYIDLAEAKGKALTKLEKLHLRGLLSGLSPNDIAQKRHKTVKAMEVNLSKTLYQYIKTVVNKDQDKVENWRDITKWLEEAGYKISMTSQLKNNLPINATVRLSNANIQKNTNTITLTNNTITIDINIQLTAALSSDMLKED